ncbi:MAG: hypothetical protein N2712_01365, partial [Brevinematales bacterium]|nr:hypothetical protein [Brevinematales bacterium]
DDVGNVSEKVEKNIIISADPRNIILIPDKQVITLPTDKLTVSSFRDVSNVISYRIVVVSERDGSIIREFKESANIKLTKDGKIASGKPLEFKSIVWDLKKSDGELAEKGIYVVQGEFEFVGNVIRKSFPAEVRIDY